MLRRSLPVASVATVLAALDVWRNPVACTAAPQFTSEQVAKHNNERDGIWVTFKDGVYDVTDFVAAHPGGKHMIMQAAGGAVDPFWGYWAYHFASKKPRNELAKRRIGSLSDYEAPDGDLVAEEHAGDPVRDPKLQDTLLTTPYCSESKRWVLADHYHTPNAAFYVRNHTPVPHSPGMKHMLSMTVPGGTEVCITLGDLLKRFPRTVINSVMQCCGNRAAQMIEQEGPTAFSDTPFDGIDVGLIGNAEWAGVRLQDVLLDMFPHLKGASEEEMRGLHVTFTGLDGYESSTPLSAIMEESSDCLLATEMNGEPLPPDHGAPVRVLLPGIGGARNVKWVQEIKIAPAECGSCWNSVYYKDKSPTSSQTIQQLPMQSLILSVAEGQTLHLHEGKVQLSGIAWGGGSGNAIERVELSVDDGATWERASMLREEVPEDDTSEGKQWSWVRWTASVAPSSSDVQVLCRAVDVKGNSQPRSHHTLGGYLFNGWHKVRLECKE